MLTGADAFAQKKMPVITWTKGGELPPAAGEARSLGVAGPATGIHGQMMFVAGGANFPDSMPWQGGKKKYHKNIYIFKKKGGILTAVDGHFQLPEAIAYAATCSTPRGVICAGGENEQGISQKVYLLRWAAELNALVIDTLPPLPLALTNASATAHNNIVYIAGGEYPGGVSNKCWFIDIDRPAATWQELPALPRQVAYAAFIAIKTKKELKLVLAGGRKKTPQGISELYDAVFEFSTLNNKWKERAPLPYA
ncbi:MAG: hypothetical protein JNM68_02405, partial [Dinghuibacter sp.]|nr:hypothetical protein [Dinghuibacter sp.]